MSTNARQYRIDDKVIPFMLLLSVLFLVLMAFRFRNDKPCSRVQFSFRTINNDNIAYPGDEIFFTSETRGSANQWEWNFGDKKIDRTSGPVVSHEYAAPGNYTVTLTINGKCTEVKNIDITERKRQDKLFLNPRWPADKLKTGMPYLFQDSTAGGTSWTWYFEDGEAKRITQSATYQFNEAGEQKVILVVNGRNGSSGQVEKTFMVEDPAPVQSAAVPRQRIPGDLGGNRNGGGGPVIPEYNDSDRTVINILKNANKPPAISKITLEAYLLDINGNGGTELRKHMKNSSPATCTINFNQHTISFDDLKDNIREHSKNGATFTAEYEPDSEGYIEVIRITASLKVRTNIIGKEKRDAKQPKYPH